LFNFYIVALTWDQSGGLLALTINTLQDMVEALKPQMDADVTLQLSSRVDVFAKLLPAFTGCAWMIITMLCFALSQNILAHFHKNVRTSFSLQELHIPTWMVLSVALTGLLGMMAPAPYNYIGLNLSIMLGTPFVFVGLAVVHAWALTTKSPKIILTIFYVLASMIVWSVLVVATLGVIDQWFNFRQRLAIRPKAHLS